jgi:hypothetical protein
LFLYLPDALDGVNNTFEPATGLVRFGLVQDTNNHACSYGTERRRPEDREQHYPPKNARCKTQVGQEEQERSEPAPNAGDERAVPDTSGLLGIDSSLTGGDARLPARMSDWSWTLLYLNGV